MTSIAKRLIRKSKPQLPIYKDAKGHKTLLELINVYPDYGVGLNVIPIRLIQKGNLNTYFKITRVKLKDISHGSVNGIKYWKGKKEKEEGIPWRYSNNWYIWPYQVSQLRDLDVDSLNHEKSRLENSIFHLTRSINELESFINDQNSSDNNFEFELAIKENEEVITNQDQGMDTGEEDGVYL
ncbi:12884_t:CDS:2 [Entrophospora sp. SA101]|nr:9643_t:CDS:2 [Entrophospora sp. SA101]CAJ0649723.1 867_t:CDS:2 [Entrophospora sp. SA101]CAJ0758204.1 12884_t:CDS:2 [Entrophospora sp. SA101]CAJ0830726.1 2779_t:CDS:2 [Entrophospora sp. SA101]CAJ0908152.1 11071_t:CDS:2 [Entrophospora sp. SA101]